MAGKRTRTAGKKISNFLLGNEAIARGALEAGVNYAAGYPGTPSTEIMERLADAARARDIYVEWSTNEKVACEGAAAAAISGLTCITTMKNAGLSVALDFLTHLSLTGLGDAKGSLVAVVCDDPNAHSSGDETDSRWLARFACAPLIEPTSVQEARDIVRWAFDLSREYSRYVMVRSYTRLSHGSSMVELEELPPPRKVRASSNSRACLTPYIALPKHEAALRDLEEIRERFEDSAFNAYEGPRRPDLLIVCSGNGHSCAQEAVEILGLGERVGIVKLVTLWPFPKAFVRRQLAKTSRVLVVEEVDPVVETFLKETIVDAGLSGKSVMGKGSGHIPAHGEITPDRVLAALSKALNLGYQGRSARYSQALATYTSELLITRALAWCPGCPHRGTFWALGRALKAYGKDVFVTGDIGCYTLDVFPEGKCQMNLLHAMGSGIGLASGLGQLGRFDYPQAVVTICGDSTFFHASVPGLVNAVYSGSNLVQIVLDNDATAMTGFQAHPGVGHNALGEPAKKIEIERLCEALDVPVRVVDPFDLRKTRRAIRDLLNRDAGVRLLVSRRPCELVRMKKEKRKPFQVRVDQEKCRGEECGVCYHLFQCPAFALDPESKRAKIREDACPGCGLCADVCPFNAISREEIHVA